MELYRIFPVVGIVCIQVENGAKGTLKHVFFTIATMIILFKPVEAENSIVSPCKSKVVTFLYLNPVLFGNVHLKFRHRLKEKEYLVKGENIEIKVAIR